MKKLLITAALSGALLVTTLNLSAAEWDREHEQKREQLYGSQLMTEQERAEQRAKMRHAETREEQERIREEHHERMETRAQERGVELADPPGWGRRGAGMALEGEAPLYGSQLMTERERAEQRARMRSAATWEEQLRIRKEHHERMEKRAKERGIDLPDEPMPQQGPMGQGYGGMGSGGMGSGGSGSDGGRK